MPEVTVLYFAQVRDRLECDHDRLVLPLEVDAATILAAVCARHPTHAVLIAHCRVAVDQQFLSASASISAHSEIALIPPVSGG